MPSQPTDIIEPIEAWERDVGSTLQSDWEPLVQKSWPPNMQPTTYLLYWQWINEVIILIGATSAREFKLYYNSGIAIPVADDDPLGFINAESYLAPKAAALACESVGAVQKATRLHSLAESSLELILQTNVLQEQSMPIRRRPYRRGRVPFMIR